VIRRELKTRLIALERRYAAAVNAKRDEPYAPARWAREHALRAASVLLYGEPKIEEPLRDALFRMEQKLDKEFGAEANEYYLGAKGENPNGLMRSYLCSSLMFSALPGANDNCKFEQIFSKAPVWFLKFTGIEWMQSSWASNFVSLLEGPRWDQKLGAIEINGHFCLREQSMPEGHVRIRTNHGKEL